MIIDELLELIKQKKIVKVQLECTSYIYIIDYSIDQNVFIGTFLPHCQNSGRMGRKYELAPTRIASIVEIFDSVKDCSEKKNVQ